MISIRGAAQKIEQEIIVSSWTCWLGSTVFKLVLLNFFIQNAYADKKRIKEEIIRFNRLTSDRKSVVLWKPLNSRVKFMILNFTVL